MPVTGYPQDKIRIFMQLIEYILLGFGIGPSNKRAILFYPYWDMSRYNHQFILFLPILKLLQKPFKPAMCQRAGSISPII
jgi:hypothetical protein